MSRSTVSRLPNEIRRQLHQRLIDCNFGDFDHQVQWLAEAGYPVSRSALHRYAQENRAHILGDVLDESGRALIDSRLRCLELAATRSDGATAAELITEAERLLRWVYSPLS